MAQPAATYWVGVKGERVLDNFRGDRITGTVYRVVKAPPFADPTEYEVTHSTWGEQCTCEGYRRHNKCKHLKMVQDYLKEEPSGLHD